MSAALILQTAFKEMNVKEIKGKNHNPRVLHYHKFTSLKASTDEVPWCSSFLNFVVIKSGYEGTNSALVRSFETWGIHICEPVPGCIAVFTRGDDPKRGHGGVYLYETKKYIYVIGGNQSDSVSIAPIEKSRLIGYRVG